MTKDEFKIFWTNRYSDSPPISHTFKHVYPERWFRIHSLPRSKRYPGDEDEWTILLNRQNTLITDIIGDGSQMLILSGYHHLKGQAEVDPFEDVSSIINFSFSKLDDIDLHKLWPEEYNDGQLFTPLFSDSVWSPGKFDNVLRDIAQDSVRVFFVSVESNALIAPYDGGVDLIMRDRVTRDKYRAKYTDWLSKLDDGL